jgi:hypothetical protein
MSTLHRMWLSATRYCRRQGISTRLATALDRLKASFVASDSERDSWLVSAPARAMNLFDAPLAGPRLGIDADDWLAALAESRADLTELGKALSRLTGQQVPALTGSLARDQAIPDALFASKLFTIGSDITTQECRQRAPIAESLAPLCKQRAPRCTSRHEVLNGCFIQTRSMSR